MAAAALLAACGGGSKGPEVASLGSVSTTTAVNQTGANGKGGLLAYSQCMRSHGVPGFPDPDKNGGLTIKAQAGGNGLDPNSPAFRSAETACKKLAPGGNQTPAEKARARTLGLAMSKCMRAHGILDFPDPNADGGIQINAKPGSDLGPDSPAFKAASKVCMPRNSGTGPSTQTGGSSSGSDT